MTLPPTPVAPRATAPGAAAGTVVAGLGLRPQATEDAILALLAAATAEAGRRPTLLAAPAFRQDAPGLHRAAAALALPLRLLDHAALLAVQPLCPTRSAAAERATGLASIAEACALAAAGPGARLLLQRRGSGAATCALAVMA
ncbi:cobalamin biosynthesis protein [Roseomonas sp. OT10]|uniref:cobalamin biosynthesis protein n=1 Tax=Roseomonas cutis TaxID=2897332 RepID=UPI001E366350|nr:cobalamin biosynthesis protein [Roseomonas sp. OT10]UFN47810.1 cobalamin biosynthesis protein [Roseomonas sp. OT10]